MRAIDADELKEIIYAMQTIGGNYNIIDVIDNMKTLESRPKGKWEHDKLFGEYAYVCSFCHTIWTSSEIQNMHYCPTCGADMRGDDEQENNQEESNNMSWGESSSEPEESEQPKDETFNNIHDFNDGIFDPTYINDIADCSDLGIYPWGRFVKAVQNDYIYNRNDYT